MLRNIYRIYRMYTIKYKKLLSYLNSFLKLERNGYEKIII